MKVEKTDRVTKIENEDGLRCPACRRKLTAATIKKLKKSIGQPYKVYCVCGAELRWVGK